MKHIKIEGAKLQQRFSFGEANCFILREDDSGFTSFEAASTKVPFLCKTGWPCPLPRVRLSASACVYVWRPCQQKGALQDERNGPRCGAAAAGDLWRPPGEQLCTG